jgi:hypothetical protein
MTMELLERHLVDHLEADTYLELKEYFLNQNTTIAFTREFTLPSGRRVDLYGCSKPKPRLHWILEFKRHADRDALDQLLEYSNEAMGMIYRDHQSYLFHVQETLVASTFDERLFYLAPRMGVQLLQVNVISKNNCRINPLTELRRRHHRRLRRSGLTFSLTPGIHIGRFNG